MNLSWTETEPWRFRAEHRHSDGRVYGVEFFVSEPPVRTPYFVARLKENMCDWLARYIAADGKGFEKFEEQGFIRKLATASTSQQP